MMCSSKESPCRIALAISLWQMVAANTAPEQVGSSEEPYNLLHKWWFYVLVFLGIYIFVVAVHLFFDYKMWCKERDEEIARQAQEDGAAKAAKRKGANPSAPVEQKKEK